MSAEEETVTASPKRWGLVIAAWLAVTIPLGWGVLMTLKKAVLLFGLGEGA